jgi:hypothetical protein
VEIKREVIEFEGGTSEESGSSDEGEDAEKYRSGFIDSMKEF